MDLVDVFLDVSTTDLTYENDYMKVIKILKEIKGSSKHHSKRVQLVIWKNKKSDIPDLDIRNFSNKTNKYKKGITLSMNEAKVLFETLKEIFYDV